MNFRVLQALIFDLDGVVWRGETPIPGAAAAIARLRELGIKPFFATNNSSRPPQFFAEKLHRAGIAAAPDEVVTSSSATALYVARQFPRGISVYAVGEEGIALALQNVGARVFLESDFAQRGAASIPQNVEAVVVGIDREFSYAKLRRAQSYILGGAKFIATNRDATFPIEGGVVPGAGSVVAAVETASGTVPVSLGKPAPAMLELILETHGFAKESAAMVGDRLDTDIACAHRAGIGKIWVATGVDTLATAQNAVGELRPDVFLANLDELVAKVEASRLI
mgnify:FL=1